MQCKNRCESSAQDRMRSGHKSDVVRQKGYSCRNTGIKSWRYADSLWDIKATARHYCSTVLLLLYSNPAKLG